MKIVWKVSVILTALVLVVSGVAMFGYSGTNEEGGIEEGGGKGLISLVAPPFIDVAGASPAGGGGGGAAPRAGTTFLEKEAGISAYVNIGQEIDLEKAETAFKSIETANESYIIGQIALDGYDPEYVAPHAYVHKDGWIVTYYLKNESSGKIMQWNGYSGGKITTTTLADTIKKICDSIQESSVPPGTLYNLIKNNISYYDFEFPNANRMMLITEWVEGSGGIVRSDQFNLTIPTECKLYEASWSHHFSCSGYWDYSRVKITDADYYPIYTISEFEGYSNYINGEFTPEQLSADGMLHIVTVEQYDDHSDYYGKTGVALVLIYRTS